MTIIAFEKGDFMKKKEFGSLTDYCEYPIEEMEKRSFEFYEEIKKRHTVREFSDRPVPASIIENCIRAAGTAPSGANMQPWHFVVVNDLKVKQRIHAEAEKTEQEFYSKTTSIKWVNDLKPLGANENKPFLRIAPHLIVIFSLSSSLQQYFSVFPFLRR